MQTAPNTQAIRLHFHAPCFDGAVSAALAGTYLERVRGYREVALQGVNYDLRDGWLKSELPRPCAIVDFLYHPSADFWADHHPTAFLTPEARLDYESRHSPDLFYDREATSCALLIWRKWGAELSPLNLHFEELVHWADRVDSARYASVEEAVALELPALQINLALGTAGTEAFSRRLVGLFRELPIEEVNALPEVRNEFEKGWALQQLGMERLAKAVWLTANGIVAFDVDGRDVKVNRYAPFHFYPDARYSAGIARGTERASITTMRNPWREFPSAPLGEICAKFGGGGHRRVGSIVVKEGDPKIVLAGLLKSIEEWEAQAVAATGV